jgi:glucoamylase
MNALVSPQTRQEDRRDRPPAERRDGVTEAPGAPGIAPTWSSSAKDMVGCALGPSRLWFTTGYGILNEVYYPRIDIPQIRDLGFIVGDGRGFWVEVKRQECYQLRPAAPGVPAVEILHDHERFRLTLRVTPDPQRDALLIEVELEGDDTLAPYALLAPHLGGTGHDNTAEVARYRGRRVLWAEQGPFGLALAAVDAAQCDAWRRASAGYVGASDGWQDFARHGAMRWEHERAGPGNVALMGELPRRTVLALGLGSSKESAATLAISALVQPFDGVWRRQEADWTAWHARVAARWAPASDLPAAVRDEVLVSAMVLRAHQDKTYPGAMVASLSVPWGSSGDERGGYHLVWPRDLVECAGALLALGAEEEARDVLRYLIATQHEDGHWYQNQWLGGKPYWQGIQLDEVAFPVLLAAALAERDALDGIRVENMAARALSYIVRKGPVSDQDRWEEDGGVNTFTLAVCIAGLVAGARFLAPPARDLALGLADYWNARTEDWTAVHDTEFGRRFGVGGYYVRVAPPDALTGDGAMRASLPIKNRRTDPHLSAQEQIGVDFLQLVRFGLRLADDPLVCDTLRLVDALLELETSAGRYWHRYNGDGYGEHADGRPFDGTGIGRAWPLLTGERGHYEVAAGRDPMPLLEAMAAAGGHGGMLPEQVWDSEPVPEQRLYPGRPSGSAMPLVWAHAEFIKLVRSRELGRPFDRCEALWARYRGQRPSIERAFWTVQAAIDRMPAGASLRVCLPAAGTVHWGLDGWTGVRETPTREGGLGLHVAELPTAGLHAGQRVDFTYRLGAEAAWAGRDYHVAVDTPPEPAADAPRRATSKRRSG